MLRRQDLVGIAESIDKGDPSHQKIAKKLVESTFYSMNLFSKEQSLLRVGIPVSIRHLMPGLTRDLWRALLIGEAVHRLVLDRSNISRPSFLLDRPKVRWSRGGLDLLDSVLRNFGEVEEVNAIAVQPKAALPLRVPGVIGRMAQKVAVYSDTSHPKRFAFEDLLFRLLGKVDPHLRRLKNPRLKFYYRNLSMDAQNILLYGYRKLGWAFNSLPPDSIFFSNGEASFNLEGVGSAISNVTSKISGLSPLTNALVKNCIFNFSEQKLSRHWQMSKRAYDYLSQNRSKIPSVFISHPDSTPVYCGFLEACGLLNIPTLEIQHGTQHVRYHHLMTRAWRYAPDIYLSFGDHLSWESELLEEEQQIANNLQQNVRSIPGAFLRGIFYSRKNNRKPIPEKILFGSYYTQDWDLCEYSISDRSIWTQELKVIEQLIQSSKFEVTIKIRPGSRDSLLNKLSPELLKKVRCVDTEVKASFDFLKSYDAIVSCYYSTMLLQGVAIGVPVVFAPSADEVRILPKSFLRAISQSPEEVRFADSSEKVVESLVTPWNLHEKPQEFSRLFALHPEFRPLSEVARTLDQAVLSKINEGS